MLTPLGCLGLSVVLVVLVACGSKSGLSILEASEPADSGADTGAVDSAVDSGPRDCVSDAECDDGLFCNGTEACVMSLCVAGAAVECIPPPDGCLTGVCDEALRECAFEPVDADADAHLPERCGGDDCNDENPTIFGGAPELCDYEDNDCNGDVDESLPYVGLRDSLLISTGFSGAAHPDVVFNETGYHAVFDDSLGSGQVRYVAVSRDGREASTATQLTFSSVLASSSDLVWTGSELTLWHHHHLDEAFQGTVSVTDLDAEGRVLRRAVPVTSDVPDADQPAAAFNGAEWGVVYVANLARGAREVRFLQARRDATVTVRPWVLASSRAIPHVKPGIAWTGSRFVVAWGDGPTVVIQGLRRTGTGAAWTRRQRSVGEAQVALAFADGDLAATWTSTAGIDAVHYARYSDRGALRGALTQLTPDRGQHTGVSMAWFNGELAVVYQETRASMDGTFIVRFAPDLRWLSPPGAVDSRVGVNTGPAIAPTGREYGLAYPDDSGRTEAVRFRLAGCE